MVDAGKTGQVNSFVKHPTENLIIAGYEDRNIRIFDPRTSTFPSPIILLPAFLFPYLPLISPLQSTPSPIPTIHFIILVFAFSNLQMTA